jgi:hypothetical protein
MVTHSSATLNATVNPEGREVTSCFFEYGPSERYGSRIPCESQPGSGESSVPVSASLGDLSDKTIYHFQIVATNAAGRSYGLDETFRTSPPTVGAHFHLGGKLLGEARHGTLAWGNLTLSSEAGTITCATAVLGRDWNPPGEDAGEGETLAFASGDCEDEACPGMAFLEPLGLPWGSELITSAKGVFEDESYGVRLIVGCENPLEQGTGKNFSSNGGLILWAAEFETPAAGLTPRFVSGVSGCNKPAELEYGEGSGSLYSAGTAATLRGNLKICGYENSQLLGVEE